MKVTKAFPWSHEKGKKILKDSNVLSLPHPPVWGWTEANFLPPVWLVGSTKCRKTWKTWLFYFGRGVVEGWALPLRHGAQIVWSDTSCLNQPLAPSPRWSRSLYNCRVLGRPYHQAWERENKIQFFLICVQGCRGGEWGMGISPADCLVYFFLNVVHKDSEMKKCASNYYPSVLPKSLSLNFKVCSNFRSSLSIFFI